MRMCRRERSPSAVRPATRSRNPPVRAFRPSVQLRHVAVLLALPLVGSACTLWQATPVTVPGSPIADCTDWNTFYFNKAATLEDISACLALGADPNAESETGWTPLHFAAANKDLAVIQALMAAGADPKARNYGGRGVTPLEIAVRFNDSATVFQALMAADPATGSSRDWQLLHTAGYGTAAELRMLLDRGGDPHERDTVGLTLLHRAASNNDASVTHALLAAGTDPTAKDNIGWTPLHVAASTNRNVAVTEALLAAGADPNAKGNNGSIPLHHAARSNSNAAVTQALLAAGADPNAANNNGETPVQWAVRYSENVAAIQSLNSAAADPNATLSESSSRKSTAAPPTTTE